ncbi:MAG: acyltransferase family protein [Bacteroidales bacterium]|nr:acyltransferase family protein [Bacteroidales bacterium]
MKNEIYAPAGTTSRKFWLDNLRWVVVLLVLFYHVIYFYNNKGVFGGIGGFGPYPDCPQYQDVVMYILYPWFMPLLFLLAGMSARYGLEGKGVKEWFNSRTRKLLVPGTIGLLVFQWMVGYFNTAVAGVAQGTDLTAGVPGVAKYIIWSFSGIGPLWFIQDLWLFSLLLLIIRKLDPKNRFHDWCGRAFGGEVADAEAGASGNVGAGRKVLAVILLLVLGLAFFGAEQLIIRNPRPESPDGLYNLYKPLFYFVPFLMGYFIFSNDSVHDLLGKFWVPTMAAAVIAGGLLIGTSFGQDNTSPAYLGSPLNCAYGWLACLAMIGWFRAKFDRTGPVASYLTKSSYGLYIVHYLVIASLGYMMKVYTQLPPVAMYAILTVAVFTLSPLLYELLRRIPFIRWAVLGERKR